MLLGGEITIATLGPGPPWVEKKSPIKVVCRGASVIRFWGAKSPSSALESLFKNSCHTRATNVLETTSSPIS